MRSERIEARLTPEARDAITRAAALEGVSASDFIQQAAFERAQGVIKRHQTWTLNQAQNEAVLEAFLNPPIPGERLRRAFERHRNLP